MPVTSNAVAGATHYNMSGGTGWQMLGCRIYDSNAFLRSERDRPRPTGTNPDRFFLDQVFETNAAVPSMRFIWNGIWRGSNRRMGAFNTALQRTEMPV